MDISINVEDYKLNVRTAGIIVHNNKILLHKNENEVNYALIGGRVTFGETSENALKREIQEELGKNIDITGYIATIENLFRLGGKTYHEIMFVHKAEFTADADKQIEESMANIEGKDYMHYEWLSMDELDDVDLRPESIKTVLKTGDFSKHIVNDDRRLSYDYIGKDVEVIIDRPIGSKHPKHGFIYELNYGYIPNTVSGDGEELDCYVLGVEEELDAFKGQCIAVIHRINDDDDKLIIVPKRKKYTDEEIKELTNFQEQYFKSEIIR